ncbi:MAG: hypothetical protein QOJ07_15 [Thermoleophilaceae bacterium]|nr:hypothetical protein [Thermoleophilaceae bacterium]
MARTFHRHDPIEQLALFDALFGHAPVGMAMLDADLRYMHVNATLAAINGIPVDDHVGRHPAELLPDFPEVAATLEHVLESGESLNFDLTGRTPADPHSDRAWFVSYYPLRGGDGATIGVGAVVVDVTDRLRAADALRRSHEELRARSEQERFLLEASRILASSLDLATTLESVAELAVPAIAEWCAVDLVGEQGRARNVALAHADPAQLAVGRSLRQFSRKDAQSPLPVRRVIETGRYELHAEAGPELLREAAADDHDREVWRSLDIHSVMILPMVARGRTIGAISFVAAESRRRFGEDDVVFAERLAAQCALAVDNARLYGERAEIARQLQESLLPPLLPELPGFELAARYRAAGAGNEVGGDFYDVFPTGPDNWLLAIGDVQGKGPAAAAVTGPARYTMRAAATQDPEPRHVLGLHNDALLREEGGRRFLTVVYASLSTGAGASSLCVGNGGHPLPFVVRADGSVEAVGRHGLVVGILEDAPVEQAEVELHPGDAIVLYTDGVIEAAVPGGGQLGEDGLARLLEGCAGHDADGIADSVARAVLGAAETPRDDVAVLVARLRQPAAS